MARTSNGIERWRGEVTEALRDIRQRQEEHRAAFDSFGERFEAALKEHIQASIKRTDDTNHRVSLLETAHSKLDSKVSKLTGKVAVYAIIGAAAVSAFVRKLVG